MRVNQFVELTFWQYNVSFVMHLAMSWLLFFQSMEEGEDDDEIRDDIDFRGINKKPKPMKEPVIPVASG